MTRLPRSATAARRPTACWARAGGRGVAARGRRALLAGSCETERVSKRDRWARARSRGDGPRERHLAAQLGVGDVGAEDGGAAVEERRYDERGDALPFGRGCKRRLVSRCGSSFRGGERDAAHRARRPRTYGTVNRDTSRQSALEAPRRPRPSCRASRRRPAGQSPGRSAARAASVAAYRTDDRSAADAPCRALAG